MRIGVRLLMTTTAVFLALLGLLATFLPHEIVGFLKHDNSTLLQILIQLLGAQWFAMAMLDWMVKDGVIGGIYNRPIIILNFIHFFIGALALIKSAISNSGIHTVIFILAAAYSILALLFGCLLFRNPVTASN